jgi:DNA helicase II / ATP-dependent DNA helicase PcrA
MSDLLANLNPEQQAAVTLPNQSALILAGAGSGKTRVLTTRIAWLVSTGQISPGGILAVTFTNKAAKEMLTRLTAMLPINTRGMWVGTFHGLNNRLLRAHHRDAGLPQLFQILDIADQLSAIKRVMKALKVDDEKFPPRQVQYFINAAKDSGLRAPKVECFNEHERRLAEIYAAYDEQCNREGVVDFAELLLRSYELLMRNELLLEHYRARFKHILVDEFQDTNRLQYAWLKLLCGRENSIFAVGDDDQSIYAFRGANVGNMRDFERDFHIQTVIKLEQNYRSHGNILDAANALIGNNSERLGKNLWTSEGHGEPVRVFEAMTDIDEAQWIVEEVRALVAEGLRRSEIAVLYRSNAQSRVIEHALFSAGIPYRVYGGLRFFERQEIKNALAYLRLMASPDDDTAFLRVVNFPTRGIGARSLEQLQDLAASRNCSLHQAVSQLTGKAAGNIGAFVGLIDNLRAATQGLGLPETIEHMIHQSGLVAHYQNEREGADRVENLSELTNAAAGFIAEEDDGSLAAFLSHAALEAGEHQAGEGSDALQLMTVHSAKGLEFHSVFISGLEQGLFPHDQSANERDGVEEERRLMYVAITRARRRLYLSFTQTRMLHGQTRYNVRSRFFDELPDGLLKWLSPRIVAPQRFAADFGYKPASVSTRTPGTATRTPGGGSGVPGWRIGQNVMHPKFGNGVIVDAEGSGSDARVQVKFADAGVKWLALQFAKLAPA